MPCAVGSDLESPLRENIDASIGRDEKNKKTEPGDGRLAEERKRTKRARLSQTNSAWWWKEEQGPRESIDDRHCYSWTAQEKKRLGSQESKARKSWADGGEGDKRLTEGRRPSRKFLKAANHSEKKKKWGESRIRGKEEAIKKRVRLSVRGQKNNSFPRRLRQGDVLG